MTDLVISSPDTSRLHKPARRARPMLARAADALYWLGRYVERSEHVARTLLINTELLTDVGDMAPDLRRQLWQALLQLIDLDATLPPSDTDDQASYVPHRLTLDDTNPTSILSCITRARDNARTIRESISREMWENLNTLYWQIRADDAKARFDEAPTEFSRAVINGTMLFQGLTDQTMPHAQAWQFIQLGKHLERVDITCRILETRYRLLRSAEAALEAPLRNILWMSVLRMCCSIEAYRRVYLADFEPLRVVSFVLFEPAFPRSIRFGVQQAQNAAGAIKSLANPTRSLSGDGGGADRILGRLNAELEFADEAAILHQGLPVFLQSIRHKTAQAAASIQHAYFLT